MGGEIEIPLLDKGPRYDSATVTILNVKQSADESDGDESEVGASVPHAGPLIEDEFGDEMDDYGSRGRSCLPLNCYLTSHKDDTPLFWRQLRRRPGTDNPK